MATDGEQDSRALQQTAQAVGWAPTACVLRTGQCMDKIGSLRPAVFAAMRDAEAAAPETAAAVLGRSRVLLSQPEDMLISPYR
jgi:hypothetical protein